MSWLLGNQGKKAMPPAAKGPVALWNPVYRTRSRAPGDMLPGEIRREARAAAGRER